MEPNFVIEWHYDNKSLYELVPVLRNSSKRIALITTPLIIIISIFLLTLWGLSGFQDSIWLVPLPVVCLYFICDFFTPYFKIYKLLKTEIKLLKNNDFERVSFFNDYFQIQLISNNQIVMSASYAYANITHITTTPSYYCFNIKLNKLYTVPIMKNTFIIGNTVDFIEFLKSKLLL